MEQRKPFIPPPPPPRETKKEERNTDNVQEKKTVSPKMPKFPPNFPKQPPKMGWAAQKNEEELTVSDDKSAQVTSEKGSSASALAEHETVPTEEKGQEKVVDVTSKSKEMTEIENNFELEGTDKNEIAEAETEKKTLTVDDSFDDFEFLLSEEKKETVDSGEETDAEKLKEESENEIQEPLKQKRSKGVNWQMIAGWSGFVISAAAFAIFIFLLLK